MFPEYSETPKPKRRVHYLLYPIVFSKPNPQFEYKLLNRIHAFIENHPVLDYKPPSDPQQRFVIGVAEQQKVIGRDAVVYLDLEGLGVDLLRAFFEYFISERVKARIQNGLDEGEKWMVVKISQLVLTSNKVLLSLLRRVTSNSEQLRPRFLAAWIAWVYKLCGKQMCQGCMEALFIPLLAAVESTVLEFFRRPYNPRIKPKAAVIPVIPSQSLCQSPTIVDIDTQNSNTPTTSASPISDNKSETISDVDACDDQKTTGNSEKHSSVAQPVHSTLLSPPSSNRPFHLSTTRSPFRPTQNLVTAHQTPNKRTTGKALVFGWPGHGFQTNVALDLKNLKIQSSPAVQQPSALKRKRRHSGGGLQWVVQVKVARRFRTLTCPETGAGSQLWV